MKIIQTLLILLVFHKGYSQSEIGIKAGINYTNNVIVSDETQTLSGFNIPKRTYRTSYHVGIAASMQVSEKLQFTPEVLFSNKGFTTEAITGAQETNVSLNYVNIPLLLQYDLFENTGIQFGPEVGLLLTASQKIGSEKFDVGDFWNNKIDFGMSAGASHQISERLKLHARYTHGFLSVVSDIILFDEFGDVIDDKVRFANRAFQLSLVYSLMKN
ncbi:MAG: porin family protein [Bacteroidota bacterium]